MRVHAYIHTNQYYGKRVEKHLLFFTIMMTKSCYLLFSVILFWLTERMFHIGSFFSYGVDWAAEEPEVKALRSGKVPSDLIGNPVVVYLVEIENMVRVNLKHQIADTFHIRPLTIKCALNLICFILFDRLSPSNVVDKVEEYVLSCDDC